MKFEYLEHTSEAKFRAYGKTLEEAFQNAGLAMINLMVDVEKVNPVSEHEIELESKNLEALLYDFLDELIYLVDVEGVFISEFELEIEDNYRLTAVARGDKVANYDTHGDVKAPTYDEMQIEEEDGWVIQVVVDV